MLIIGMTTLVGGLMLLHQHKQHIDHVLENCRDKRSRLFELRKFRRRSWASTFVAAIGILMSATYWAFEPGVFVGLLSVILILLIAVMFIAFLDLMSVGLHSVSQDDTARKKMVEEYLRQRKKLLERVDDSESK